MNNNTATMSAKDVAEVLGATPASGFNWLKKPVPPHFARSEKWNFKVFALPEVVVALIWTAVCQRERLSPITGVRCTFRDAPSAPSNHGASSQTVCSQ